MAHKKLNLPEKLCPVCKLKFSWRKKWARDWEQVVYCSERCRRQRKTAVNQLHNPGGSLE